MSLLRSLSIALIALVVLCAGAPCAFAADGTVPDVVGLPLARAQALLEQAGFTAEVRRVQGTTIGLVVSQEPGGLARRAKGSAVRLVVVGPTPKFQPPVDGPSTEPPAGVPPVGPDIGAPPTGAPREGPLESEPPPREPLVPDDPGPPPADVPPAPELADMPAESLPNTQGPPLPSVLGQTVNQARGALRRWRVAIEYTLAVPALVGKVVNQWPHGGLTLAPGEAVIVVVAIAEPPSNEHTGVPQVEERGWRGAVDALLAAGFQPQPVSVPSRGDQRGMVVSQQPLPGSLAARGAPVRIRIGRGSGRATPPVAPPAQPPVEPDAPPAGVPPVAPPLERPPTEPPAEPPVEPPPPVEPAPHALATPALAKPEEGEAYPYRYGATFIWSEVPGASAYEWELEAELPSGAWQMVDSRMVPGTQFRPEKLDPGRYRWHVRAVHQASKGEWSTYRRLYMY